MIVQHKLPSFVPELCLFLTITTISPIYCAINPILDHDTQFVQIGRSLPKSRASLTEAGKIRDAEERTFRKVCVVGTHVYSHVGLAAYVNFVYLLCKLCHERERRRLNCFRKLRKRNDIL